jgi:hypothetical protein
MWRFPYRSRPRLPAVSRDHFCFGSPVPNSVKESSSRSNITERIRNSRRSISMGYGTQEDRPNGSPELDRHGPSTSSNSANRPASPPVVPAANGTDETGSLQGSRCSRYWRQMRDFYERNFGLFLVFAAQTFGSVVRYRHSNPSGSPF